MRLRHAHQPGRSVHHHAGRHSGAVQKHDSTNKPVLNVQGHCSEGRGDNAGRRFANAPGHGACVLGEYQVRMSGIGAYAMILAPRCRCGLEAGMLAEPELAGLLYRADWTRLTLSAGVRRVTGPGRGGAGWLGARVTRPPWISPGHPSEGPGGGTYRVTGRLLVAPGRRYRLETIGEDGQKLLQGCDGDRPWYQVSQPEDGSRLQIFGGPQPPDPESLHPSWLLTGFDLGPADAVSWAAGTATASWPRHARRP